MNFLVLVLNLLFTFCSSTSAARILGVFNHPAASHTTLGIVLLKSLARKGHHVTMISSYPLKEPMENYRDIALPELLEDFKRTELDLSGRVESPINMGLHHTEGTLRNPQVKELLESKDEKFDVVILDFFYNPALLIFGHIFNAPVVYSSSFGNNILLNWITGNDLPISYVPGGGAPVSDDVPFKERAWMFFMFHIVSIVGAPLISAGHEEILRLNFNDPPTVAELRKNVALVLSNSHYSFETPRPYTPNIIPVGGMHIVEPKPLPDDLLEFVESADHGVIYFSLGTQLTASLFDAETLQSIVDVFSKVQQKVLFTYDEDHLANVTDNIKIVRWVPQRDVLAHPNVKLFVSHGGMLSLIESIHCGVPMICIPFNGDQFTNGAFLASREIGSFILKENINTSSFYDLVQEVIMDARYRENMKVHSSLLRNQQIKPIDNAVFWVEHVIAHKMPMHLIPFSLKLPWHKYYMVDVLAFFLAIVLVVAASVIFLCLRMCRFRTKKAKSD